jgi:hypothetical protein
LDFPVWGGIGRRTITAVVVRIPTAFHTEESGRRFGRVGRGHILRVWISHLDCLYMQTSKQAAAGGGSP